MILTKTDVCVRVCAYVCGQGLSVQQNFAKHNVNTSVSCINHKV